MNILTHGLLGKGFGPRSSASVVMWHSADIGAVVDVNGKTMSLADQGIRGNVISQGIATRQPTYVPAALNGLPVLQFRASDMLSSILTLGERTYFMVVRIAGNATGAAFQNLVYQNLAPYVQLYQPNGAPTNMFIGATAYPSGLAYRTTWMLVKAKVTATTNRITVNGAAGTLHSHPVLEPVANPVEFGSRTAANFDYAASVICDGTLSDTDEGNIENYLKAKYALTY